MYFGSVRFFKHLILCLIALGILLPTTGLVLVRIHNRALIAENRTLAEQNRSLSEACSVVSAPEPEVSEQSAEPEPPEAPPSFGYQQLYPDLYVEPPVNTVRLQKTVCLTFDDGPTAMTDDILDLLGAQDVKATFFLVGRNKASDTSCDCMRRIIQEGHSIGIHTYSHEYTEIYSSVEAYLSDFNRMFEFIVDVTGVTPRIFRFPGGSINGYNRMVYQQIIAEMTRRGFVYFDWNLSASDTASNATVKTIQANILNHFENYNCGVVLMHDGYRNTLNALETIITGIKEKDYDFGILTHEVSPTIFAYRD